MNRLSALWGLFFVGMVAAEEPTLPASAIIEAWENAGAEQAAISKSSSPTRLSSSIRAANKAGEIPAFRITENTKLAGLKEPAIPFGLVLTGGVKDEQLKALPTFNNLQYILAYGQPLTGAGAKDIARQKNLRYLDLGRSQMSSVGMKELATLAKLETLHIDSIKLIDAGLAPLVKCQALRDLNIDDNDITYTGVRVLGELPNLETLGLLRVSRGEGKEKAYGEWFTKFTKLRSVRTERISDDEMKIFASLKSLRVLEIDADDLTVAGMKDLAQLTELEGLSLRDAKLTSAGYKHLLTFTKLQRLSLLRASVTDADVKSFTALKALRDLNLYGTKVSDTAVTELKKALPELKVTK